MEDDSGYLGCWDLGCQKVGGVSKGGVQLNIQSAENTAVLPAPQQFLFPQYFEIFWVGQRGRLGRLHPDKVNGTLGGHRRVRRCCLRVFRIVAGSLAPCCRCLDGWDRQSAFGTGPVRHIGSQGATPRANRIKKPASI